MEIDIKYFLLPITCIFLFAIGLFGQQPIISSVSHNQGFNGQLIEISGSGFSTNPAELIVRFGAMNGTIISSTNNFIEVAVPIGATLSSLAITNSISGLIGYSTVQFYSTFPGETTDSIPLATRTTFASNKELFDLVIVDLDEDGKNDVIATKIDPTSTDIVIYRNTTVSNTIAFAEQSQFIGNPTVNIGYGDIDGDGKVDLVISRGGDTNRNQIYVLRNTSTVGTISFAAAKSYFLASTHIAKKTLIRDLDLDGKPEVVVSNTFNNQISIFKNNSTPGSLSLSFTPTLLSIDGANTTNGLAIGDLNNDGKPDLVVSQYLDNDIYIVPNESVDGNLIFGTQQILSLAGNLNQVAVADLNLDEQLDLLVTMPIQTKLAVFKNEGTGFAFSEAKTLETGLNCWSIGLGDYTGNVNADIIVSSSSGNTFSFFKNVSTDGNIELTLTKTDIGQDFKTRNVVIGDLSGDAKPDIALTTFSSSTSELLVIRNTTCIEPQILNNNLSSQICNSTLPFVFKVMPAEGTTFIWKNAEVEVQNSSDSNFEAGQLGVYTVTSVSEGGSCIIESQKMALYTVPKPSFIPGDSLFIGLEVKFSNTTDSIFGQSPIYNWDFGDGTTSTDKHPIHTFTEVKDYLITLLVIYGDVACSNSSSQLISIKKLSSETKILSFTIPQQIAPTIIDSIIHTINIDVKYDSDVLSLVPTFTLSNGANAKVELIDQVSGVTENNFVTPLNYTVTAEDRLSVQEWIVTVSVVPNLMTDILSFNIPQQIKETLIDSMNHTVKIEVELGTNVSKLTPTFILADGASATIDGMEQVSSVTENDFTDPITYTIHAYSEGSEEWVVIIKALNIETEVKSFSIPEQASEPSIDLAAHTIGIEADFGTDLTSVVPTFSLSLGATAEVDKIVQVSGSTPNNFTSPVTYKIIAENGFNIQDWTVTISTITGLNSSLISPYVGIPYPNPYSNSVNIPFITVNEFAKIHITMIDIFGTSLFKGYIQQPSSRNFNYVLDMNSLGTKISSGIYILEIEIKINAQVENYTRKVFFKGY